MTVDGPASSLCGRWWAAVLDLNRAEIDDEIVLEAAPREAARAVPRGASEALCVEGGVIISCLRLHIEGHVLVK